VLVVIVEQQRNEERRLPPIANYFYVLFTVGAAALGEACRSGGNATQSGGRWSPQSCFSFGSPTSREELP